VKLLIVSFTCVCVRYNKALQSSRAYRRRGRL